MTDVADTEPEAAVPDRGPSKGAVAFYACCRVVAVGLSRLLFPGTVVGRDRLPPTGAYVVAPIHRSNIDWLVVARITRRRLRFLAKAEIWRYPRVGRLIEHLGAMPVQRNTTDRQSFNRCLAALAGGEPLVLFPEGTRGAGERLGELHEGAAYLALRAGVPIVPVGLAGTDRILPKGRHTIRPARVRIVIGEPILPERSASSRVPRSLVAETSERLRDAIQRTSDDAAALLRGAPGDRLGSSAGRPTD